MTGPVSLFGYSRRWLRGWELKFGRGYSEGLGQPCFDVIGRLTAANLDARDHRLVNAGLGRELVLGQFPVFSSVAQELRHTTRSIVI